MLRKQQYKIAEAISSAANSFCCGSFESALGPHKSEAFMGAQVRVPIDQLKAWLEEKLAY